MTVEYGSFTPAAQRVMAYAHEEAMRFNHGYIGTEHLLLGLARERDGLAAQALAHMAIEPNKLRAATEFIIGASDRPAVGLLMLTPRAKRVVELATDEARLLGSDEIDTEHLLLGLLADGDGIAASVLTSLGADLERTRAVTRALISGAPPPRAPEREIPSLERMSRKGQERLRGVRVIGRRAEENAWRLAAAFTVLAAAGTLYGGIRHGRRGAAVSAGVAAATLSAAWPVGPRLRERAQRRRGGA
jgi:ATP-dependent Clp protease ATP-binding subunit ClpA